MQLTKENIVNLLRTNDRAIAHALLVLHNRQTYDEQLSENTKYLNGQGFRPCHARKGSSMAQFYQHRGYITAKQAAYWRVKDKTGKMRIEIYWKQLIEAAKEKAAREAA